MVKQNLSKEVLSKPGHFWIRLTVFHKELAANDAERVAVFIEIYGPLFFASVATFNEKFDVINDPQEVIIDFKESRVADISAIEALNKITEKYQKAGKRIKLRYFGPNCLKLLKNAEEIIDINVLEDPTCKVAVNKF